jgi:hypothetical protein
MAIKIFGILLAFLMAGSALAQDAQISLRLLQLGGDEMPDSWVRSAEGKGDLVKLAWLSSQPSAPVKVTHDGQLKLFRYITNDKGEKIPELANTIKLPAPAKEVLLLGWEKDDKAKYVAIKDQFLNAKFNDWMAINASENRTAVLAGDKGEPVLVEPGKSMIFQPNIQEGKGVKIIAKSQRKGELKTFLSSYWPAFSGQRTLIIFYDDGNRMRAKRIGDRFIAEQPEAGEE